MLEMGGVCDNGISYEMASVLDTLCAAQYVINNFGYVAKYREEVDEYSGYSRIENDNATFLKVRELLDHHAIDRKKVDYSRNDYIADAESVIAWVRALPEDESSYNKNLKILFKYDIYDIRAISFVVSAIAAKRRAKEKARRDEAEIETAKAYGISIREVER